MSLRRTVKDFLSNSTLHGLKYIGDSNLHGMERFVFAVSFCLAIVLSAYYINEIYGKWKTTPVIFTIDSMATSIRDIPFPAVTICNMNQAQRSRVASIKGGTTDDNLLRALCHLDSEEDSESLFNAKKAGTWQYFRQFILNVSQPCNELLLLCRYGSITVDCHHFFSPFLTDEGLCCTFNAVHPRYMHSNYSQDDNFRRDDSQGDNAVDWNPESGYVELKAEPYFPVTGLGTGVNMGLTVVLNASLDEYFCSSTNSVGFKVLLHSPIETPKIAEYGLSIQTGMETRIVVIPIFRNSTQKVRKIGIKQRQCLFLGERDTSYFRTYTSSNCRLECESQVMEAQCGCVMYYMPRPSSDSVICGPKDMTCINQFVSAQDVYNESSCHECLPECVGLHYESTATSAKLHKRAKIPEFMLGGNKNANIDYDNFAVVHFFYESNSFRGTIREEFQGFVDFIASSGGILGLFLGFSILSGIELMYFFFIAPCYGAKRSSYNKDEMQFHMQKVSSAKENVKPIYFVDSRQNYGPRLRIHPKMMNFSLKKVVYIESESKAHALETQLPYCE